MHFSAAQRELKDIGEGLGDLQETGAFLFVAKQLKTAGQFGITSVNRKGEISYEMNSVV